jgi:dimeric dUTPase (all-alpha-NTP-PPase superfamily)
MNLTKLFEMQKVLRNRIAYNEPDRFNKLVLALLVELGECANEWRGFKFWSKNQKPRTKILCIDCGGTGELYERLNGYYITCPQCRGSGVENKKNPLLEEYVDGLHFVLELGIELKCEPHTLLAHSEQAETTDYFINLYFDISDLTTTKTHFDYRILFSKYITLGEMLGFTWNQIEQAYYTKNSENHRRQENGY